MRGFLTGLRTVLKYGAYITVLVDIIGYAIEKLENLDTKKDDNTSKI
jgi:hypothetical protein